MNDTFEIILITHGALCKGYYDALKLILEIDDDDLHILSFENGESLDSFSDKISDLINEKLKDKKMFILTDLPGGSPANVSLPYISPNRKFVSGINLPFLLELMIGKKNGISWDEVQVDEVIKNATASMVYYNQLLKMEE